MKKCTVIINPTSGKGLNEKLADKIKRTLTDRGYETNVIITEHRGHAEEIVQEVEDDTLVISVGGDGTFYEVMNGNFQREHQVVLSHIPQGTTNDIGHMYGLGKDVISNINLIVDGEVHDVDICSINGRSFVYVASYGKFMEIPYETPQELKHRLGHMAYLLNGARGILGRTPRYDITYEIDGVKHNGEYSFFIISNANRIAGINNFYNDVKLDDKKFEVMFCSIKSLTRLAQAFLTLKTSDIKYVHGIEMYKTDNLRITFNGDQKPWCLDGEKYDSDTSTFVFDTKKRVRMLVPKANVEKLFVNK